MTWAARWVGRPWVPGESDCWSLARAVWASEFGREVPPLPVDPRDFRAGARAIAEGAIEWVPVTEPADGDAVVMARGVHPCHIGVWVTPDRVLHAIEGAGSVCTPMSRLDVMGYRIVAVLRRPEWGRP